MSLRSRLRRLEQHLSTHLPPTPEWSAAERWLDILRLVERFMAEQATDRLDGHRQAIALLEGYVAGGQANSHLEHFCDCCLEGAAAWRRDPPYGGRVAFLEKDHWPCIQEAHQTGERQRQAFADAFGHSNGQWAPELLQGQAPVHSSPSAGPAGQA